MSNLENKVILLVEDDPDDESLTVRALTKNKILNRIIVAHDGAEALDYLFGKEKRPLPELVLLDLKLPKVDGLEVLRRIRGEERTKMLPVIIFTSSKEDKDVVNGYKLGCNSYVRKPVDFDQFVEAVHQLQLYWLLLNEPPPQQQKK